MGKSHVSVGVCQYRGVILNEEENLSRIVRAKKKDSFAPSSYLSIHLSICIYVCMYVCMWKMEFS